MLRRTLPTPRGLLLALPGVFVVAVQPVFAQVATAPAATAPRVAASPAAGAPAIGTRTRITSPALGPGRRVATVVGYRGDTLVLRPEGTRDSVGVPLTDVTRLDVSLGRQTHVRKGLLVGLLGGAAVVNWIGHGMAEAKVALVTLLCKALLRQC